MLLTVKTGPVVVGDADAADDDGSEAEEQTDIASADEQFVFPERDQGVPLRQTQLDRVAGRPVRRLLLLPSRLLLLFGGRWRRDFEGERRMTASVQCRIVGRKGTVGLALLDLKRRVDESVMHHHHHSSSSSRF